MVCGPIPPPALYFLHLKSLLYLTGKSTHKNPTEKLMNCINVNVVSVLCYYEFMFLSIPMGYSFKIFFQDNLQSLLLFLFLWPETGTCNPLP